MPAQDLTQAPAPVATVVSLLVSQGKLSQDQLQQLQAESSATGQSAEALIEDKKLVDEKELAQTRAEVNQVPFVNLEEVGVYPEALASLTESVARKYQVLPFALDKQTNTIMVAMVNPLDLEATEFISQKTGMTVVAHYATKSEVERNINERYAQNITQEVGRALEETPQAAAELQQTQDVSALSGQVIRQAPITKIVETILTFAINSGASDVHIEPQEAKVRVRYRIDGILQERLILPKNVHEAVVSKIKILADMKIDEKRVPQDGRFDFSAEGQSIDLRTSTLPTIHGEKIVMRLLKKDTQVPSLTDLGMEGLALKWVETAIHVPHGIVLVTGPTGSGKTTTLYSILHKINTSKVNIMTVEDPVEYQIQGVNQVQTNPQAGLTFASGLRSFLRQDPNIIMVGEIRDNETMGLALQASLTGHLVFSTLHTSSAATAVARMIDMEAEPFLLASTLTLIMGQRIARRLNPEYREEYKPEPSVLADIKQVLGLYLDSWCSAHQKKPDEITLFRSRADRPETELEYKGRVGIYEVMKITDEINRLILDKKPATDIEQAAIKNGMLLMKQDGYIKALDGVTTLEEVLRVAEV